jgi:hypothetical protein
MRIGAWRGNLVWVGKGRNRGRGRADELEYDLRTRAIVRRSEDRGRKSDSSAARFSLLANLSPIVLVLELVLGICDVSLPVKPGKWAASLSGCCSFRANLLDQQAEEQADVGDDANAFDGAAVSQFRDHSRVDINTD